MSEQGWRILAWIPCPSGPQSWPCPPPGTGCSKSLANVDAAVGIKKEAGRSTKLVLVRVEEVPKVVFDDNHSHISEPNMGDFRAGSRSDSVPSFNTNYSHSRPVVRVFVSQISKYPHVRGLAGAKILVQVTNKRINCKNEQKGFIIIKVLLVAYLIIWTPWPMTKA